MDPMQLFQLQQMMQQRQQMGQQPLGAQTQPMGQPQMQQGQLPSYGQPQLPSLGQDSTQHHSGGGLSPLMMLSPMGGMLMSHPGAAMFGLSPALGLAHMLGAFK